jgi:hypothetical protein
MLQLLKDGALCIHVLSSAQRQQENTKEAKEKDMDMLQMQATCTLH